MKISDLFQIMHRFLGTKKSNYEFIQWLPTLLMRDTTSDEEDKEDENEKYYPFGKKEPDKNFKSKLGRFYNGTRKLPIKDASTIISHYDDKNLKVEFDALENPSRLRFINELNGYGITTEVDKLEETVSKLIYLAFKTASNGESDFDIPDDLKIKNDFEEKVKNEKELKDLLKAELLLETKLICPYDGCYRSFAMKNENKSRLSFKIVAIDKNITELLPQNYIALCTVCAEKYLLNTNEEVTNRLKAIKEKLSKMSPIEDDCNGNEKILEAVGRVIQKISSISYNKISQLKYEPITIDKKLQKNNPAFYLTVRMYINNYFAEVNQLFQNAKTQDGLKFDRFCQIIRNYYQDLFDKKIYEQNQIFEKLATWLSISTNEDSTYCGIVVAYFIQKCEVFDEIA